MAGARGGLAVAPRGDMYPRLLLATFCLLACARAARASTYTLRGDVPLRAAPGATAEVRARIDANETVVPVARQGGAGVRWVKVRVGADLEGYVEASAVSDLWIQAWKRERQLML